MFHDRFGPSIGGALPSSCCRPSFAGFATALLLAIIRTSPAIAADATAGSPISKVYIGEVHGDNASIQIGDRSQPLSLNETYPADGIGVETRPGTTVGLVFSNGLAVDLHTDTRVEVRHFTQEPFRPDRTDVASEPSISNVELVLTHGTAVISTNTLAPGSRLVLQTPQAALTIQGGTLIVSADATASEISVISGGCTIYERNDSTRVEIVKAGQMATARIGVAGESTRRVIIEVSGIAADQLADLTAQASSAVRLKRTVYFEQKQVGSAFAGATAFDGPTPGNPSTPRPAFELNPVPLMSGQLPVQYVVSPAALVR